MSFVLLIFGQIAAGLPWGEVRNRDFWQLYGAELRKTSAYNAPHAYTLLLNGADVYGLPYQVENPRLSSWGDSAVSGCIRMDSIGPAYVSFAYQRGGRMEPPEVDDTLTLWGLDADGQWVPLWQAQGIDIAETTFTTVHLPVQEARWLHPCFRLKWTVWGSTYGAYDNWHVAYTLIRRDTLPLRPVWMSLPRIYDEKYGIWGTDHIPAPVGAIVSGDGLLEVESSVRFAGQELQRRRSIPPPGGETLFVQLPSGIPAGRYPLEWILTWGIVRPDTLHLVDTLILESSIWGYDDGEMEAGYGLRQLNRAFCQVFHIDTAQRLSRVGVRFFAVPTQYGKPFQLGIWDMAEGIRPLYLRFERILIDSVGGWQWFEIDTLLIVRGEIGVGFIQADNQPLAAGWDASCAGFSRVRVESAGGWIPSQIEGCMMVRIELTPPVTALSVPFSPRASSTMWGRAGEPIAFSPEVSAPVMVWSADGRLVERTATGSISLAVPGLYVCTDARGQVWRLVIMP